MVPGGFVESCKRYNKQNSTKPQDSKPWGFCFNKEQMTTDQEIVSFEQELEKRNFVFTNRLLEQLLNSKMNRLREQYEHNKELHRLTQRHS